MNIVNLWDVASYNGHIKRLYIPGYLDSTWDTRISSIVGVVYSHITRDLEMWYGA